LALAWFAVAAGGLSSVLFADREPVVDAFGIAGVVTATVAGLGVVFDRYRWEWVAAWFTAAAMTPYVFGAWGLVAERGPRVLSTAFLLTALVAFFALRALMCAAHAAKLRAIHEEQRRGDGDV
jgi:hypothetical protein